MARGVLRPAASTVCEQGRGRGPAVRFCSALLDCRPPRAWPARTARHTAAAPATKWTLTSEAHRCALLALFAAAPAVCCRPGPALSRLVTAQDSSLTQRFPKSLRLRRSKTLQLRRSDTGMSPSTSPQPAPPVSQPLMGPSGTLRSNRPLSTATAWHRKLVTYTPSVGRQQQQAAVSCGSALMPSGRRTVYVYIFCT
jgi:hypothetical protein